MKFILTLDREDYLTYQLFTASESEQIRKRRIRTRYIVPAIYLILSVLLFFFADLIFSAVFLIVGFIWLMFYPSYERKRYIRFYNKYLNEHYMNRFGKTSEMSITDEYIMLTDFTGESKIKISEIINVSEITDYLFVKFSTAVTLILPKRMDNYLLIDEEIKKMEIKNNLSRQVMPEWHWK